METIDTIQEMRRFLAGRDGLVALVPTMGYLHEGHASLMREARRRADTVVASVFVNPIQFGVGEDLESYPRDLERDRLIAGEAGADVIFAPTVAEMYPQGYQSFVNVEGITGRLCGASRPGHFRGVTTVVTKLLNIVQPGIALFGMKDFQQLAVIRTMVADLNMNVEIVGMPIVREPDGLALSSRNARLDDAQRKSALCLSRALFAAKEAFSRGERSAATLSALALAPIGAEVEAQVDYLELCDSATLEPVTTADEKTLLALAVKIGTVRLIDNCILGEE
ncbi:pantoate--beta-alanine ligase [Geomonas sp. RF6]|uniref:pantoate--beta-alanine ligase n=1 Tax=Geomonas sp. RF6 TaxID=2897342 RepID=UPI001E2DE560|nr:pantoate--beta-alanine ligase [Geomonas sp. RF6]UFS72766.1 pantoate--beta-alanine ligase [Geomonas sp. RF6]